MSRMSRTDHYISWCFVSLTYILSMNTAVQLWDGQLSVITTPIPHVSTPNEVLVKVAFSGICGTDLHILAGEFPSAKCVILGHEFAGVVSEVGAAVKGISVGDR